MSASLVGSEMCIRDRFKQRWRYSVRSIRLATRFDRYPVYASSSTSLQLAKWSFLHRSEPVAGHFSG
eukprot:6488870-Alexandrium_andersonii.AAC.1